MQRTESLWDRIPTGENLDRAPTGPRRPRQRPTSWAAGMAPFGRCQLAFTMTSSGRSPGTCCTPPSQYNGTALGAGTYTPTGSLAAPVWAEA